MSKEKKQNSLSTTNKNRQLAFPANHSAPFEQVPREMGHEGNDGLLQRARAPSVGSGCDRLRSAAV